VRLPLPPGLRVPARGLLAGLLLLVVPGCLTPGVSGGSVSAKPGWGRAFPAYDERLTVRVVPGAARPTPPPTLPGKPGWGR